MIKDLVKENLNAFNPQLPFDEQSEFLPYDEKWEFPKNRLQLGKLEKMKNGSKFL